MAGQARHMRGAVKQLVAEIERQILPDGGHVSRNPGALIELLLDFLPLRQAFQARNLAPPPQLNNAIDRMMPMMRFFRHGDGAFAHFNGMGPTLPDLMATILAYDDARGAPLSNAPHSGYQRVEVGEMVLLMDAGAPPPINVSQEAHAGCLSFELSHGLQRIVVNCGLPATNRETWRQVARATAAHSTVVFNDTSSCRFLEGGSFKRLLGTPIVSGPTDIQVAREERGDAIILRTSHDGYADRFKVIHQRALEAGAGRQPHRRRGPVRRHRRRHDPGGRPRRVRGAVPPASLGQGQQADRRPRRHADAAEPRRLDLQRLRGPRRDRGKRLSVRRRRPAPRRADRDLRPRPQNPARALDLHAMSRRRGSERRPPPRRRAGTAAERAVDAISPHR